TEDGREDTASRRARARGCYEAASPRLATLLCDDFVQGYHHKLPALVQCLVDDFEACVAHLRFRLRQRKVIRTTDESVKWFSVARQSTLRSGTGDPVRSAGHEAASPAARGALGPISRPPLWPPPVPHRSAASSDGPELRKSVLKNLPSVFAP